MDTDFKKSYMYYAVGVCFNLGPILSYKSKCRIYRPSENIYTVRPENEHIFMDSLKEYINVFNKREGYIVRDGLFPTFTDLKHTNLYIYSLQIFIRKEMEHGNELFTYKMWAPEKLVKEDIVRQVFKTRTLEIKGQTRDVTVCVVLTKDREIRAGYSVRLFSDADNKELAERIAQGRALVDKTNLLDMFAGKNMDQKYILLAICFQIFRDITNGNIEIKGIR